MRYFLTFLSILFISSLLSSVQAQSYKEAKKKAKLALANKAYGNAIQPLKEVLIYKPDDANAHMDLCNSAIYVNRIDENLIDFYRNLKVTKTKVLIPVANKFSSTNREKYAYVIYEKIQEMDEKEPTSLNFLGKYCFANKEYEKAYTYYFRRAKYLKDRPDFYYNEAGRAAMVIRRYEDAKIAFEQALKLASRVKDPASYWGYKENLKWATREIRDKVSRPELMKNPVNVEIENMGEKINSKWGDYFGSITADESMLLFTSVREGGFGNKGADGDYPEDFWYSVKDSNGEWTEAKNLGKPINSRAHEGLPTLSADGHTIYFYMSGVRGDGNVYMSTITGDSWSKPIKMPFCEDDYWESQPSVSSDGNTIYFVSRRDAKDPYDMDIFYATRERSGTWSKARNIGKPINTGFGEMSPFIHPDGKTLFFSSQGHAGVGDYDIFKSVKDEKGNWSDPVNIGYPINTEGGDNGFFLNALGTKAFYHSEKENGNGAEDMYVVHLVPKSQQTVAQNENGTATGNENLKNENTVVSSLSASAVTTVVGTITDEISGEPIGTSIEMQNISTNERIQDFNSNSKTGKYVVVIPAGNNYAIAISKQGYLFHSENFNIPKSAASSIITRNIKLKKIEVGKSIVLNNVFFETGSAELTTESTLELERIIEFLNKEKSVKMEISGHTDNVGSEASNQTLSEQRAKSVVDYLISKGMDASRMVSKGYGESQPIADNGTQDGRHANRRTEFKVLSK